MRKVEQIMCKLLRQHIEGKASSNTEIRKDHNNHTAFNVILFGNGIASYYPATGTLFITDAGWQTVTTLSRLNALLQEFAPQYRINQHKWKWYITDHYHPDDGMEPWPGYMRIVGVN